MEKLIGSCCKKSADTFDGDHEAVEENADVERSMIYSHNNVGNSSLARNAFNNFFVS
jgi:hypothetical protein